eukprot:15349526-Ditylum_brightwellii.AAC.1
MESLNFMDQLCSCNQMSKVNGQYAYQGKCHKTCIIYEAQCKICTEAYIGCTQNKFKARMMEYFADITRLTSTMKSALLEDDARCSDTFAKHFAKHFSHDTTAQQLYETWN